MRINGGFLQTNSRRYMMAPDRAIGGTGGRPDSPLLKVTEGMIKQAGWKTDPPFDKEIVTWGDQRKFLRECKDEYELFEIQKKPDEYLSTLLSRALTGRNEELLQGTKALSMAIAGELAADLIQPYAYHCRAVSVFSGLGNGIKELNGITLDMPEIMALALCDLRMQLHTDKAATLLFSLDEEFASPIIQRIQDYSSERFHELVGEMVKMSGGRPE